MRVLQTISSTDRRGAEIFGLDLHGLLRQRGYDVLTYALAPGRGISLLEVPTLGRWPLSPLGLWRLRGSARGADVMIGHGSRTLPVNALSTPGLDVPVIYRSIGDPAYWTRGRLQRARTGAFLHAMAAVVVVWHGAKEIIHDLYQVPRRRIRVIPRGVPCGQFEEPTAEQRTAARTILGLPPDAPVVVYLGALSEEKDPQAAVRAVASVDDVWLVIAGDGPLRSEAEGLAQRLAPDRIRFLGSVREPAQVLRAADVLLLSSRTEGTPGVLIEAGLMGVPAVATRVGGVPEMVQDGRTGVLVPPGDQEALSAGLQRALNDRQALGEAAHSSFETRFALEVVTDAWEDLLRSVADGRAAPVRRDGDHESAQDGGSR